MTPADWLPSYTNETVLTVRTCLRVEDFHNFTTVDTALTFAYICFVVGIITGCIIYYSFALLRERRDDS